MPLNSLLVKTSSLSTIAHPASPAPSPSPSASSSTAANAKKLISNGFFNLLGRSNINTNKLASTNEENKQFRRTSSTQLRAQRKTKQQTTPTSGSNGNKRLSADVESVLPVCSTNSNHGETSTTEDMHRFDKVATSSASDRQSTTVFVSAVADKNTSGTSSSHIGESPLPPPYREGRHVRQRERDNYVSVRIISRRSFLSSPFVRPFRSIYAIVHPCAHQRQLNTDVNESDQHDDR